jgi:hypothetical protein
MLWPKVCAMDVWMRFVSAVLAAENRMTALCEKYGISR